MKLLFALALVCSTTTAFADTRADLRSLGVHLHRAWVQRGTVWWIEDSEDLASPSCQKDVAALVAARVPDSETFMMPGDAKDLSSGRHTFAEAKANCNQIAYVSKVKAFALEVAKTINAPTAETAKRCVEVYARTIKAGVKPTEVVPQIAVREEMLGGSIEALRIKFCDPLLKR